MNKLGRADRIKASNAGRKELPRCGSQESSLRPGLAQSTCGRTDLCAPEANALPAQHERKKSKAPQTPTVRSNPEDHLALPTYPSLA